MDRTESVRAGAVTDLRVPDDHVLIAGALRGDKEALGRLLAHRRGEARLRQFGRAMVGARSLEVPIAGARPCRSPAC